MHLTLVFLGYQSRDSLATIDAALGAAALNSSPFQIVLGRVGTFGSPGSLQVIWVGLQTAPAALEQLHGAISSRLSDSGVPFDRKPLVPHITLARSRRPVSLRISAAIQGLKVPALRPSTAEDFVLMESRLSRMGPEYNVVGRFPLIGAGQ
jgi:2'-5' RNA ligase